MPRKDKSKKKMQMVMGLFIACVMIFSVFGIIVSYSDSSGKALKYNDIVFNSIQGGFRAKINGDVMTFSSFPGDLENIELPSGLSSRLVSTKMFYLTYDPDIVLAADIAAVQYLMQEEYFNYLGSYPVISLTKESEYDVPVINCINATFEVPVIIFLESEETSFDSDIDNPECIIFKSNSFSGFLALKDRLLFSALGVMD